MADEIRLSHALLRPWRMSDAASLARHANNRNVSRNLRDAFPFPYAEVDAREFLTRQVGGTLTDNLAIEVAGEAAGGIGLRLHDDGIADSELDEGLVAGHYRRSEPLT